MATDKCTNVPSTPRIVPLRSNKRGAPCADSPTHDSTSSRSKIRLRDTSMDAHLDQPSASNADEAIDVTSDIDLETDLKNDPLILYIKSLSDITQLAIYHTPS